MLEEYLPQRINHGPWVTAYTLEYLWNLPPTEFVLPICSLKTPLQQCADLGELVLPPIYTEACDEALQREIVERIATCYPVYGSRETKHRLRVVEVPPRAPSDAPDPNGGILAFSVDTAVEEHGPHLPLATDTLQSYSVLEVLARQCPRVRIVRPLDYGQLTWGLPFGFSVDLTAELVTRYVRGYVDALTRLRQPDGIYVVDVHGSITHRQAIVEGLQQSSSKHWSFRWLHEPLAEFASARGDQHAGGVETALVERISPGLLDQDWWPGRIETLAARQMSFEKAVELTPDLEAFIEHVDKERFNGIIGDILNYRSLDAEVMFERMLQLAIEDIEALEQGTAQQSSGAQLW